MKKRPQNFALPSGRIKKIMKEVKDYEGRTVLLKGYLDIATKKVFVEVTNGFARYNGYVNRTAFLTKYELLHEINSNIYNDPGTGVFLIIEPRTSTRQYLN